MTYSDGSSYDTEPDKVLEPLTVEQIFPYYDQNAETGDPDIQAQVRQQKLDRCQRAIQRINRSLEQISERWGDATPLQIYVAFMQSCQDPEEMLCSMHDPEFMHEVEIEVERLKAGPRSESPVSSPPTVQHGRPPRIDPVTGEERHRTRIVDPNRPRRCYPKPEEVDQESWDQWSEAHQESYLKGKRNPNTYFYRNLAPGETQKNGGWDEEEKELFLRRLEEMKRKYPNEKGQWGIFSQAIPGRVGYQCSNFYRKLVASGEIQAPEYEFDDKGKLKFKFMEKPPKPVKPTETRPPKSQPLSRYERKALKNPLKGEIDFVTKAEIQVPAISPDGYVLDYNTWMNIIADKAEDPFTRKHINKRQITILTTKNIEEFRHLIKNIQ
jgi:hypothetical protein